MTANRNPVLLLAWGLPLVAVVASVLTLFIAMRGSDGELPEQYHWEGFQLDRDFSRAARAAELKVRVTISGLSEQGACDMRLQMQGATPNELLLTLAHATKAERDRRVTFRRSSQGADGSARYEGACSGLPEGHWRIELVDLANDWAIRRSVQDGAGALVLDAAAGSEG
jgi:uncharacterized protein